MRRGYGVRMKRRLRIFALAAVCAGVVVLSGCAPGEEPTPTPTAAFASDEEAFAAAEETYRAYVDALNQVDLSDPDTFEPVYALTIGEVNSALRKQFSQMHADEWRVEGESIIKSISFGDRDAGEIEVDVCLDVSNVALWDSGGASQVQADRPDIQPYRVTIAATASSAAPLVALISAGEKTC